MDRTFIKDIILLILVLFIAISFYTSNTNNRYTLFNGKYGVILLDKKTGITWRQVTIDEKEEIPAAWEEMLNVCEDNTLVPIGRKHKVKKALKNCQIPKGYEIEKENK